ncbi:MAG: RNA methyltransferase [Bacteroidales bacterium]|nr:RNA methyltransferase [Bacteroidales bacterium]
MRKLNNEELNRLSTDAFKTAEKLPCVVVLDNIRSLNNIGSVFRTSDAFRIEAVYLCGITATPPHREIHKTALGATDSVKWQYFTETENAILKLKSEAYRIFSVEQAENSITLEQFVVGRNEKIALVFGHEVNGVEQSIINISDGCIEIPQFGTKHSLNVSVSAGIVIWEVFKKYARFI